MDELVKLDFWHIGMSGAQPFSGLVVTHMF